MGTYLKEIHFTVHIFQSINFTFFIIWNCGFVTATRIYTINGLTIATGHCYTCLAQLSPPTITSIQPLTLIYNTQLSKKKSDYLQFKSCKVMTT